jgi:hypothetical protein
MILAAPPHGAFLGRPDVQQLLVSRIQGRHRSPLPMPRFSGLCDDVAAQLTLGDQSTLGWPPALVELIDTLCCAQNDQASFAFLDTIARATTPGTRLDAVPLQFLRHLISDPDFGARRYCGAELSEHLASLDSLIARRLTSSLPDNTEAWHWGQRAAVDDLTRGSRSVPTLHHYVALLIRSIAEMDAAKSARWSWQAASESASGRPISAADTARRWQLDTLCGLIAGNPTAG